MSLFISTMASVFSDEYHLAHVQQNYLFFFLRFVGERRLALPRVCLHSIEERKNKITPVLQAVSQTDQKPGI